MTIALINGMAVIVGIIVGCIINMAFVMAGPQVIPLPAGVDMSDAKNLAAHAHLLEPKNFVFPFLAHALGTLSGAFTCHLIAATHRALFAYVVGSFFLAGGVAASFMVPAQGWFIAVDLVLAYIPTAWLGARLRRGLRS